MTKLDVVLAVALLGSGLLLVKTAYDTRRLFAAVEGARAQTRQLDTETKRLEAERLSQGAALRVERTAREKLQMRSANPAVSFTVVDAPAASTGPAR